MFTYISAKGELKLCKSKVSSAANPDLNRIQDNLGNLCNLPGWPSALRNTYVFLP